MSLDPNAETAAALGLKSSFNGGQRNYLTFASLNMLIEEGKLTRTQVGRNIRYVPVE